MIVGCCGAGKSVLSSQLSAHTGLPIIHLDQAYWCPNWVEPKYNKWRTDVANLVTQEQWIMDGNYAGTWDLRLPRTQLVIYLDYSLIIILYRVLKRLWQHAGQVRPDMAPGCPERFSWSFIKYIWRFDRKLKPKHLQRLSDQEYAEVLIFKGPRQLKHWLQELQ